MLKVVKCVINSNMCCTPKSLVPVILLTAEVSKQCQAEHVQAPLASYEQHYVELAHSKTPILLES